MVDDDFVMGMLQKLAKPASFMNKIRMMRRGQAMRDADRTLAGAAASFPRQCLKLLRDFIAVREHGSYAAAGVALRRTPSALSRSVARLERRFGRPLFEPGRDRLEPTAAAALLAERHRCIADELALWLRRIEQWRGGTTGALPSTFAHYADLSRLIAIALVVETRSVGGAAALLGVSQPAVSAAIRFLEQDLATELFFRRPSSMIATPAGAAGHLCARRILTELWKAEDEIASLEGPIRGLVAVGGLAFSRSALLPEAICRIMDREPGITVRTFEGPVETLIDGLKSGAIDLVIGAAPPRFEDGEIAVEPLVADSLGFFVRRGHPLADRPAVTMGDIAAHRLIVPPRNTGTRDILDGLFRAACLPAPEGAVECSSASLIRQILLRSEAICFRSEREFEALPDRAAVARLDTGGAIPHRTINLMRLRRGRATAAVARFLEVLRGIVDDLPGTAAGP
jgi:LysR family transcriptional regulator of gallate degradation